MNTMPHIPVSWGEVIDKLTILEIKEERIAAAPALHNVRTELAALRAVCVEQLGEPGAITEQVEELRVVNRQLWDIEEDIRAKDRAGAFDGEFIELARAVYVTNDRRSAIKRAINDATGSAIVEEKSY